MLGQFQFRVPSCRSADFVARALPQSVQISWPSVPLLSNKLLEDALKPKVNSSPKSAQAH